MQKVKDTTFYAASDIVNFLEGEHLMALDLINLETPFPQAEDDDEAMLYIAGVAAFDWKCLSVCNATWVLTRR